MSDVRIWLDLETTDIDPYGQGAAILEAAVLATDSSYKPLDEGLSVVFIYDRFFNIDVLGPKPFDMHSKNGLLEKLEEQTCRIPTGDSEESRYLYAERRRKSQWRRIEEYIRDWNPDGPIAGSSPHFDSGWLDVHAPEILQLFNHRVFDASTLLQAAKDLGSPLEKTKNSTHRAMADIYDSIQLSLDSIAEIARLFPGQEAP